VAREPVLQDSVLLLLAPGVPPGEAGAERVAREQRDGPGELDVVAEGRRVVHPVAEEVQVRVGHRLAALDGVHVARGGALEPGPLGVTVARVGARADHGRVRGVVDARAQGVVDEDPPVLADEAELAVRIVGHCVARHEAGEVEALADTVQRTDRAAEVPGQAARARGPHGEGVPLQPDLERRRRKALGRTRLLLPPLPRGRRRPVDEDEGIRLDRDAPRARLAAAHDRKGRRGGPDTAVEDVERRRVVECERDGCALEPNHALGEDGEADALPDGDDGRRVRPAVHPVQPSARGGRRGRGEREGRGESGGEEPAHSREVG
jgi:hypothetical protein